MLGLESDLPEPHGRFSSSVSADRHFPGDLDRAWPGFHPRLAADRAEIPGCGETDHGVRLQRLRRRADEVRRALYLVSILFIIFDLEVAFLFPWAVSLMKLPAEAGQFAFWSMMAFPGS